MTVTRRGANVMLALACGIAFTVSAFVEATREATQPTRVTETRPEQSSQPSSSSGPASTPSRSVSISRGTQPAGGAYEEDSPSGGGRRW